MPLFLLALLAGVVTIAGPCILPLLPIILGTSTVRSHPSRPLFIVLGFVISFSAFVVLLSAFGYLIPVSANALRTIAAILIALFGVSMLFPKLQALVFARFGRLAPKISSAGPWSGFLLGATLGLVWTPCAGPVLGSVLTLIASNRNISQAAGLLLAYAIGAGAPMLLVAYGGAAAVTRVRAISRYTEIIQRVFGVLIILTALGIYLGYDQTFQTYLLTNFPWLFPNRLVNL
jgi:cytochrome c biogenesis protein CcdA